MTEFEKLLAKLDKKGIPWEYTRRTKNRAAYPKWRGYTRYIFESAMDDTTIFLFNCDDEIEKQPIMGNARKIYRVILKAQKKHKFTKSEE